jgi:hypothetical protein
MLKVDSAAVNQIEVKYMLNMDDIGLKYTFYYGKYNDFRVVAAESKLNRKK